MPLNTQQNEIFHHALRRDLAELQAGFDEEVWRNFAWQLRFHHTSEDRLLWAPVRERVTDPADLAVLDAMEAEHSRIDPLLEAVDDALKEGRSPAGPLAELHTALEGHLAHEEGEGLAVVEKVYTQADWDAYVESIRAQTGEMAQNPALLIPWLLKEAPEELRTRVLAALPAPVRAMVEG
jgi:hypothetical protein